MWPASGGNRYGVCASLLVAHLHCYIIPEIRQYPKVVVSLRRADDAEIECALQSADPEAKRSLCDVTLLRPAPAAELPFSSDCHRQTAAHIPRRCIRRSHPVVRSLREASLGY